MPALVILLLTTLSACKSSAQPEQERGTAEFWVTNAFGNQPKNWQCTVYPVIEDQPDHARPLPVSGASINDLPQGLYVCEVQADDYLLTRSDPFVVNGPNEVSTVFVELIAAGSAEGEVRHATGKPFAGAQIHYLAAHSSWGRLANYPWKGSTQSDRNGQYKLTGLLPGNYQVFFKHPSCGMVASELFVETTHEATQMPTTQLEKGVTVKGRVDIDGSAVAGAEVLIGASSRTLPGISFQATTGPDGSFAFADALSPGQYEVRATRPSPSNPMRRLLDYTKSRQTIDVKANAADLDLRLSLEAAQ